MVKKSIENCFLNDIASLQFDVTVVFIVTRRGRFHILIYFKINYWKVAHVGNWEKIDGHLPAHSQC